MKKDYLLVAALSAAVASAVTVFASGPGEPFTDVDEDAYYADSVYRMQNLGVVSGYGDGTFGPGDYVNRADVSVMLDRYDDALLPENDGDAASGVYNLVQLLCHGGLEFEITDQGTQNAYDEVCYMN